jgi:hypothetical protein
VSRRLLESENKILQAKTATAASSQIADQGKALQAGGQ